MVWAVIDLMCNVGSAFHAHRSIASSLVADVADPDREVAQLSAASGTAESASFRLRASHVQVRYTAAGEIDPFTGAHAATFKVAAMIEALAAVRLA